MENMAFPGPPVCFARVKADSGMDDMPGASERTGFT